MNQDLKFIDLFAGIGGFHFAIKKVSKNAKPILVSEINKHAIESYKLNHKYKKPILNIRDIDEKLIKKYDILFAGFPCQTFSNAGNKLGFKDKTRGTLFFDILRILNYTKPKYILLENVKHLVNHDKGNTYNIIINSLKDLGYEIPEEPLILSPENFNVNQTRERVLIPGILNGKKEIQKKWDKLRKYKLPLERFIFDVKADNNNELFIKDEKIINALKGWKVFIKNVKRPENKSLPPIWIDYLNDDLVDFSEMKLWRINYIKNMKKIYFQNKKFIDKWKKDFEVDKWSKRERKLEWQAGINNYDMENAYLQLRQSGLRFKKNNNIFPALVAMVQTSLIFRNNKWRYLSLDEVRRLQSFPSNYKYINNTQECYKQFGNAVNVKVISEILKVLLNEE